MLTFLAKISVRYHQKSFIVRTREGGARLVHAQKNPIISEHLEYRTLAAYYYCCTIETFFVLMMILIKLPGLPAMRLQLKITHCLRQHLAVVGVSSIYYTFWLSRESNLRLICPGRSQLQRETTELLCRDVQEI